MNERSELPARLISARRRASSVAATAVAVVVTVLLAEYYAHEYAYNVVDDAMTSMQYARNLATGNGLVFNVGERVEGYTNFLWVLFQVPLFLASRLIRADFVDLLVQANIAMAAAAMLLLAKLSAQVLGKTVWAMALVLALCVVDNSYTAWAAFGLENHFLAVFMLWSLLAVRGSGARRWLWAGVALALAHLTRPDAGLFCAVVVANEAFEGVLHRWQGRTVEAGRTWRDAAGMAAIWLGVYAVYFAWRYGYYGYLLPNTFYVKVGGHMDGWRRGLAYLTSFLSDRAWVPLVGVGALLAVRDRTARGVFVYLALHIVYVVYVGGDFFSGHRFFVAQLPMFALLTGVACRELLRRVPMGGVRVGSVLARGARAAFVAALVLGAVVVLVVSWKLGRERGPYREEILAWRDNLTNNTRLFSWLRDHKPAGASIATCLIGHTGYYAESRIIDVCAIIDPVLAHLEVPTLGQGKAGHEKIGSPEYILAQHPTYVSPSVLPANLWDRGYYYSDETPRELADGLWRRDERCERGWAVPGTDFTFDVTDARFVATGTAFMDWPSFTHAPHQGDLVGVKKGFVNSFHRELRNEATGTLRSPPFELLGDWLLFRIAGGHDEANLRATLLVDDVPVFSATGRQSDRLTRVEWDIRPLRGRSAVFEVVDDARGSWGYIAVDELVQFRD